LANASPTMAMAFTRLASTSSSNSSGSKWRDGSSTMHPPEDRTANVVNAPVPCMSGQAGMPTAPGCWNDSSRNFGSGSSGIPPPSVPHRTTTRSSWRHITPLGMPVVPPV
jgi:hypothetical protein